MYGYKQKITEQCLHIDLVQKFIEIRSAVSDDICGRTEMTAIFR